MAVTVTYRTHGSIAEIEIIVIGDDSGGLARQIYADAEDD